MKTLPNDVVAYTKTKTFKNETIPEPLLSNHATAEHSWAVIHMITGELKYTIGEDEVHLLKPGHNGIVEPAVVHFIRPLGEVEFYLEFYKKPRTK